LPEKIVISETGRSQGRDQKGLQECTSVVLICLELLALTLQVLCSLQLLKTTETQEDPDDPESVGEEISDRNTPVIDVQPQSRSTKESYL